MEFAISLKSGEYISASSLAESSAYRASVKYLLVCPECREPVHFGIREIPYNTPFFSHYKQIQNIKAIHACSLRVFGATFKPASSLIPGLQHGQTVDRFQRDFCKELYESFGEYSPALNAFIEKSENHYLTKKSYINLIRSIEKLSDFSSISEYKLESEVQGMNDSLSDICLFLESSYGEWVGNFICQVANFVASVAHPDIDESDYGRSIYKIGKENFVFIAETVRLKTPNKFLKKEIQRIEKLTPQIASTLVTHLILKWKIPGNTINLIGDAQAIKQNIKNAKTNSKFNKPEKNKYINPWLNLGKNKPSEEIESIESKVFPSSIDNKQDDLNNREKIIDAINKFYNKNLKDNLTQPVELPKIRAWHSYDTEKPEEYNKLQITTRNRHVLNQPEVFAKVEKNFTYEITNEDKIRIKSLISDSLKLNTSKDINLSSREAIKDWSGKKNSIEAYFLASILSMNHTLPKFTDPTLAIKLNAWLSWVKNKEL
jgi:hypothetical protein